MLRYFRQMLYKKHTEADDWFGMPDIVQNVTNDIYFKEWISITDIEILQIYYDRTTGLVSLKTIPKNSNVLVNDMVPWGMEFTEKQALDHLVQMNPKCFLTFHPDISQLSFTNQDLY